MKQKILILIITLGLIESIIAQNVQVPERISITDKFSSPFGNGWLYKYELELNGTKYRIQRIALKENSKKNDKNKQLGFIDKILVEKIVQEIIEKPTKEIRPSDFQLSFTLDLIDAFFRDQGDNYWINNDYQKQFIREQLIDSNNLKTNLESYFKHYDHSRYIDGPSTEVDIEFHFKDSILSIKSESILCCGLPIEFNGQKSFSPTLAALIGELIPKSKSERKKQFSGKGLFSAVIIETINNNRSKIDNLESRSYQVYIDSLEYRFEVSNTRIINGTLSTNWNGEKRLSCVLRDTTMPLNVSISYSTTIESEKIKYPVSLIINDYNRLVTHMMSSTFFKQYLDENNRRELSIIYDDNHCFTNKSKEYAMDDCKLAYQVIDFENSLFIGLKNEFGNISRWCLLPNGKYFMWWHEGNPPIPASDINYLKCE